MRRPLLLWLTTVFLTAFLLTAALFLVRPPVPPMLAGTGNGREGETTPEARLARITSAILVRKIRELHRRAIRLQFREEGRELLEEWRAASLH